MSGICSSYDGNREGSCYGDHCKNRIVQRKVKTMQANVEESIQEAGNAWKMWKKEERQRVKNGLKLKLKIILNRTNN